MIGSLRGRVIDRQGGTDKAPVGEVLLEVAGVGYRVTVTPATLAHVVVDDDLFLHVHHHFWENDQRLYGFPTRAEREAFEGLLAAHKVGPALALAIIGTYPPAELAVILETDDVAALCHVPGVGTKTAQRLLVDLKSSLVRLFGDVPAAAPVDRTGDGRQAVRADVREALSSLGYGPDEVKQAVAALPFDADHDSGTLLKLALRALAGD